MFICAAACARLAAFDASECGFSPDASGKDNTAALQRAFDRGGTVTVDRPGRYKIADTVFIGDDTSLICGAGVVFVKSDEGRKFAQVILNKGALTKTWNKNIEITGLEISVNGMDHNDWKVFGLRGHLAFFYAKDVRINRFRCNDLGRGQYCIHICTFEDVIVDDVQIRGWKDGVHFGRGRRFTVRNGVFDTGDDPIALNAHDYSSGNPELGWIEDGVIENCHDLDNPARRVGYFCRILAGAWCDWREGMVVQQGDSVVSGGSLYRVSMPVDGKTYVSKTRPTHRKGQVKLDGINWVWVQDEPVYECGVRNVVFRDIFLHQPRTAFSVHFDVGKFSRSYYPGAKPPKQEGIVFDNVQVLYTNKVTFLSVATPVDSLSVNNCTLREGNIRFVTNKAMEDYGPTKIQMNGCRFYAKGKWSLIDNSIANKRVELVTTGSMTYDPSLSVSVSKTGNIKTASDLPGLRSDHQPLTPQAKAVVENLRRIADAGQFVYSWTHPWQETDPAFRAADGDGWRAKDPDEFTFSSRFNDLTGEEPVMYFADLRFVVGTYLGEAQYAKNRASLTAMIRKAWHDYHAVPVFSWHVENPYVPSGWKDPKHGEAPYRYRHSSKGYPQKNKYVFREILQGTGDPCGFGRQKSCAASAPVTTNANPRAWYDARLEEIASFLDGLKGTDGTPIPVVVRLFHECEDDWQWWGLGSASVKEYVDLFRYTVTRLRERTGGAHLLFAYSPDRYWWNMGTEGDNNPHSFMGRYPGDGFVDIFGYDDYQIGTETNMQITVKRQESAIQKMQLITAEARRRGKACGVFETGAIGSARPDYYDWLYKALTADGVGFAFVNLWGGYEIPRTPEGKECLKRFLAQPKVLTFRDGIDLTNPNHP